MTGRARAEFATVVFEKTGAVATVTLNRPEKINAYSVQMRDDLWEVLYAVEHDPDIRAVVLRGTGPKGFCAGADLSEFGTAPSQVVARRVRWERDVFGRLYALSKPTVAALHGYVIGSGVELALLCDIRIASEDALFSMPETSLGLIPAAGGTQTLPRTVHRGVATDIILRGTVLDATGAMEIGLVSRVVPRPRLRAFATRIARQLAENSTSGVAYVKEALRATHRLPLADGLAAEAKLAARLALQTRS